ncbi:MAG TPA: N-6 DNA methylase, partial [Polyangiales bacterium]
MELHPAEQLALAAAQARDRSLQTQAARKRSHGIVHTSPELARFVLRAVDELLQDELQLAGGVGDARVHVVDPACGPGAFLAAALQVLADKPRVAATLTGIDVDAEALQLAAALEPFATQLGARLQLRCADTLREPGLLPASQVGRVLAIVGNPPWSVAAAEATEQMQQLLETFRCDAAGVRLPEKKLGVLSDAYVRFFRWAAEAARSSSGGAVVGLVTNASFLDGPVHRGMRAALLRWFDRLWVIDL